jgi:FMN phosphatase YigB (HAD superfamily)
MQRLEAKKTLGLLTFDLDDSLYPVDVVVEEANAAFARAMSHYGFDRIEPQAITETCKQIREELPPEEGLALTHTEVRRRAIRREMENVIYKRKLKETADDWATPVSDLSPIVKNFARKYVMTVFPCLECTNLTRAIANRKSILSPDPSHWSLLETRWASEAVSGGIVQAVLNAWEMERHHGAERHLYPEVIEVLQTIRAEHPNVIIGAVTDGKANPRLMTFTLAPYFDFCLSWEDDQTGRTKFFQDLTSVEGNAELKWIYDAALEKYQELSSAKSALQKHEALDNANPLWIHVGDDLAYDVGGAAQSGAKTIWLELDRQKYKQTARFRFDPNAPQPAWSTSTRQELEKRRVMNELAIKRLDETIHFISRLPEAIQDILDRENAPESARERVEEASM